MAAGRSVFFNGGINDLTLNRKDDFRGKIILTLEEDYNPDFAQAAALHGVEGILVVSHAHHLSTPQFEVPSRPRCGHLPC